MRHSTICRVALAGAVALLASSTAATASSRIAINPELVNPVVASSLLIESAVTPPPWFNIPPGMLSPAGLPVPPTGPTIVLTDPPGSAPAELEAISTSRRMSILYVTDPGAREVLGDSTAMRGLPWLFRQEPSNSGQDAALASNAQRMWKVSGANLAKQRSAGAMAAMLRTAVDKTCVTPAGVNTCGAGLVGVDEIGAPFGVPQGVEPGERPAGALLTEAMSKLAGQRTSNGDTYASRIHFYIAPGMSTAIEAGLGPNRTLGRDGKPHFTDYTRVAGALARAGGVWLEMYHYPQRGSARTAFTAREWRDVPTAVATFIDEKVPAISSRRPALDYLHFVMTETAGRDEPAGAYCAVGMGAGPSARENTYSPGLADMGTVISMLGSCTPVPPVCTVLPPPAVPGSNEHSVPARKAENTSMIPKRIRDLINTTRTQVVPLRPTAPIALATLDPGRSGMACQWQRAQSGDVNTRILANGPAAFKVTGTEADVYGRMFRQFFLVS